MSEINRLGSDDADQVFELLSKIYSKHSLLQEGLSAFSDKLRTGQYVSLGAFEKNELIAHAGFYAGDNFALINALAVNPKYRGAGLGHEIFEARLNHIKQDYAFNFVAGYYVTQHLGSQKLCGPEFKPIGLDIGYPDIYHGYDTNYNRGTSNNAEIVLCQTISPPNDAMKVSLNPKSRGLANSIFSKLGVIVDYEDKSEELETESIFLGFHPNIEGGLFTQAYLGRTALVNFSSISTSSPERQAFVDRISHNYERTIGS